MTDISSKTVSEIIERVGELATQYRDGLRQHMSGEPYGYANEPTDEQFMEYFEQMQKANPNYWPAWALCDGGMADIRRYERITGLREGMVA
jgi:hypothetical protein